MFTRLSYVLGLAALAAWADAPSGAWIRLETRRAEFVASASVRATAELSRHLERMTQVLAGESSALRVPQTPVRVIVFASERGFEPYRSAPGSPGYFVGNADGGTIVLSKPDRATLAHEYIHFLLRTNHWMLPPAMEEGLAEFYAAAEYGKETPGDVRVLEWMDGEQVRQVLSRLQRSLHRAQHGPDEVERLWNLAVRQQECGSKAEVMATLRRLLGIAPDHGKARLVLASYYVSEGRSREALQELRALESAPEGQERDYHRYFAIAAWNSGFQREALYETDRLREAGGAEDADRLLSRMSR
jgi:hypothetical protein